MTSGCGIWAETDRRCEMTNVEPCHGNHATKEILYHNYMMLNKFHSCVMPLF